MRRSDITRSFRPSRRTSQIVFGERQHLRSVLVSIQNFRTYPARERERALLHTLIDSRTAELEQINRDWDEKFAVARNPESSPAELARLAQTAPEDDYLLLRTIAEHAHAPAATLARLAEHPYDAVKECVARHPNTDEPTLRLLASDANPQLWLLVAANENAPEQLRVQLRERLSARLAAAD